MWTNGELKQVDCDYCEERATLEEVSIHSTMLNTNEGMVIGESSAMNLCESCAKALSRVDMREQVDLYLREQALLREIE